MFTFSTPVAVETVSMFGYTCNSISSDTAVEVHVSDVV